MEFKCDVCGAVHREEVNPLRASKNPLMTVPMPSKNYDCEGRNFSKGMSEFDMCKQCFENYWNYVQDKYDASDYFGIKVKGGVE